MKIILFLNKYRKKFEPIDKELGTYSNFYPKNCH